MTSFNVYPAIDLRDGEVVRLKQGDPEDQTTYARDAAGIASHWIEQGAEWLHIIDLSGAFGETQSANREAIQAILELIQDTESPVKIQYGGGLRTLEEIEDWLARGVKRVILGTAAISSPEILTEALARFGPESVAVAIDARQGVVHTQGWRQASTIEPITFARELEDMGVEIAIYTNIARDGAGTGVDLEFAGQLAQASGLELIVAGGVNALEDIRRTRAAGLSGVVIGRALYEAKFSLKEALRC
jgi:phosphoribosylformimino-5-aminoimidazole carboxamide ribotide isomerase